MDRDRHVSDEEDDGKDQPSVSEDAEVAPHPQHHSLGDARNIRKSLAGVSQRKTALAIEIFKSKNIISDKEFEDILELCDVSYAHCFLFVLTMQMTSI